MTDEGFTVTGSSHPLRAATALWVDPWWASRQVFWGAVAAALLHFWWGDASDPVRFLGALGAILGSVWLLQVVLLWRRRAAGTQVTAVFGPAGVEVEAAGGSLRFTWDRVERVRPAMGMTLLRGRAGRRVILGLPAVDREGWRRVRGWVGRTSTNQGSRAEPPPPTLACLGEEFTVHGELDVHHSAAMLAAQGRPVRLLRVAGWCGLISGSVYLALDVVVLAVGAEVTRETVGERLLIVGTFLVGLGCLLLARVRTRPARGLSARLVHRFNDAGGVPVTWSFSAQGATVRTPRTDLTYAWDLYSRSEQRHGFLCLVPVRPPRFRRYWPVIPLAFLSEGQLDRIADWQRQAGSVQAS